ncbi:hypothetical protein O3G_MSEX009670 [Manduca sexta]|uniref:Uncharacterized protein n=1 Tax=Manduca sexta TaxID=7130 RepID=A0A921ZET2_MANSE|nr:hypothetical protein O3G_MSEX009670 [Manduca sexta]
MRKDLIYWQHNILETSLLPIINCRGERGPRQPGRPPAWLKIYPIMEEHCHTFLRTVSPHRVEYAAEDYATTILPITTKIVYSASCVPSLVELDDYFIES